MLALHAPPRGFQSHRRDVHEVVAGPLLEPHAEVAGAVGPGLEGHSIGTARHYHSAADDALSRVADNVTTNDVGRLLCLELGRTEQTKDSSDGQESFGHVSSDGVDSGRAA